METVNNLVCRSRLFKLCWKIYGSSVLIVIWRLCVIVFSQYALCKCFLLVCLYKPVVFNNTSKMFLHLQVSICQKYCQLPACIVDTAVVV